MELCKKKSAWSSPFVVSWAHTHFLPEDTAEVGAARKTGFQGDLGQAVFSFLAKCFCLSHPVAIEILDQCDADLMAEAARQIFLADADMAGSILQRDRFHVVFVQIGHCLANDPLCFRPHSPAAPEDGFDTVQTHHLQEGDQLPDDVCTDLQIRSIEDDKA